MLSEIVMYSTKKLIAFSCSIFLIALYLFFWPSFIPTVIAITPPDQANAVHLDARVAIFFSQRMAVETINSTTIQLQKADGTSIPGTISYDTKRRIAEVVPRNGRKADTIYELQIAPDAGSLPRDILGIGLADSSTTRFNTEASEQSKTESNTTILIVTGDENPFGGYYAEILRAKGLNLFSSVAIKDLIPERLATTDVVILTTSNLPSEQVDQLENWVSDGGNLIAIRPEGNLLPVMGIGLTGDPAPNGYMVVDPASVPGKGIFNECLQLHVPASRFELKDSVAVALLYDIATKPAGNPAITLRSVGLGHTAAYAYDLAQSVIYTRQGNPSWINQDRDGLPPRRANDLFFPDYVDMNRIGVPRQTSSNGSSRTSFCT